MDSLGWLQQNVRIDKIATDVEGMIFGAFL